MKILLCSDLRGCKWKAILSFGYNRAKSEKMVKPTTLVVSGIICILIAVGVGWFAFPKLMKSKITEVGKFSWLFSKCLEKYFEMLRWPNRIGPWAGEAILIDQHSPIVTKTSSTIDYTTYLLFFIEGDMNAWMPGL